MSFFSRFRRRPDGLPPLDDPDLEARILAIGGELLEEARGRKRGLLSAAFWSDKLMDWAMKDEAFKVQLFRFVDAFPTLHTPELIHDFFVDAMAQPGVKPPTGFGLGMAAGGMFKGTLAKTLTSQITGMAERFIAGTDATSALPRLKALWSQGIGFSVDLLGEACLGQAEAQAYQRRYLDLVQTLPTAVAGWPTQERLETDHLGPVPRTNVSIKISALDPQVSALDLDRSVARLAERLAPILRAAGQAGVLVNFDMEHHGLKDLTLSLFEKCCESNDFPAGIALQAYLRSGEADVDRLIQWAKRSGRQVTVRLVKGAYWDFETIHAEQMGWPVPVWSRKADTDACFERMVRRMVAATPRATEGGVKLALGSHNLRSIATALALLEVAELPTSAVELQMLNGMAEPLKAAAVARGLRLREYVPVGEMIPGMAYLVRRLLENTSNESWLRGGFADDKPAAELLGSPHKPAAEEDPGLARIRQGPERHALSPAVPGLGDGRPFFSESFRDFANASQRKAFAAAVASVKVPAVANDGTLAQVDAMLAQATSAFPRWRAVPVLDRARCLVKAAALMRAQRDTLSAIVIAESGKGWAGADADVCEAIDFCEYYAREAVALFEPRRLGRFIGEHDEERHRPRGVAVVIAPWNFPLAIACGMTVAALVTGNPVVLKPAEQTPAIARRLCEILWEAGVPRDVLQFLPGPGEVVGAALVRDARVALVAFTGSLGVGLDIVQAAGITGENQSFVKKVVCEMGGKNAIIVDTSADLDEAVLGVRESAFGFQGQKCSACSRVITVGTAHAGFVERLVSATQSLSLGDPRDPGCDVGPLIEEAAAAKVRKYIEIGKTEATLALAMPVPQGLAERVGKPFVGPHIFTDVLPHHRIAREEIFGPVLAVLHAPDFEAALALANDSGYRLTGAVYSRKPSHLDRAREAFDVGNLYLNRGSTGALVGRQPFGGFGLSGVGEKAGGSAYLRQFVVSRLVCENTMRRGFAPGL